MARAPRPAPRGGGGGGRQARVHRSARGRRAGARRAREHAARARGHPALDEAGREHRRGLRAQVPPPAVVVADGGSDDTVRLAEAAGARVVRCGREMRGRASQMNAGAAAAVEAVGARPDDILIFVHADTQLPAGALEAAAASTARIGEGFAVGAFRCHIESGAGRTGPLPGWRRSTTSSNRTPAGAPAARAFAQGLRVFTATSPYSCALHVRVVRRVRCELALMEDADQACALMRLHASAAAGGCEQLSERAHERGALSGGAAHTTLAQLAVGLAWTAGVSNETLENIVTRVYAPVR